MCHTSKILLYWVLFKHASPFSLLLLFYLFQKMVQTPPPPFQLPSTPPTPSMNTIFPPSSFYSFIAYCLLLFFYFIFCAALRLLRAVFYTKSPCRNVLMCVAVEPAMIFFFFLQRNDARNEWRIRNKTARLKQHKMPTRVRDTKGCSFQTREDKRSRERRRRRRNLTE